MKIKIWIKKEIDETKLLLKEIPAITFSLFVVSIILMNILATKEILHLDWISLDAGYFVSWLAFLTMDIIVKRFGPKASMKVNILGLSINILVMAIISLVALIPGDWALKNYGTGENWWVISVSSLAFIISGFVNSFLNWALKKLFKKHKDSFIEYAVSSYGSTAIGQFVDNMIFGGLFSAIYFKWTFIQLFMFALCGMIVELIFQIIFSPIGFKIANRWKKENIGEEYIEKYSKTDKADEIIFKEIKR